MQTRRILIADDDSELLSMLGEILESASTVVVRASTGGELLDALAHRGPFDLVITDVDMPWMTGLHVLQSARTAGLATPVIVMTALDDPSLPERVGVLGEDAMLLRKPFPMDALESAVSKMIAHRPARAPKPDGPGDRERDAHPLSQK